MLSIDEIDYEQRMTLRHGEAGIERANTIKQQHPEIEGVPEVLSREQYNALKTFAKLKKRNEKDKEKGTKQETISTNESGRILPKKTGNGFNKDAQRAFAFRQQHPEIERVPDELSRHQFNHLKQTAAILKQKDEGMEMTE